MPFDLIFIDAQKSGYPDYLNIILDRSKPGSGMRLLKPGRLIIADNILRQGFVADPNADNTAEAQDAYPVSSSYWSEKGILRLREFNDMMKKEPRIDNLLLPLFDGIALGRLVD